MPAKRSVLYTTVVIVVLLLPIFASAQPQPPATLVKIDENGIEPSFTSDPIPVVTDDVVSFSSSVGATVELPTGLSESDAQRNATGLAVLETYKDSNGKYRDKRQLVPVRCQSPLARAGICVRLELTAGTPIDVPVGVLAGLATSPVMRFTAYPGGGRFFEAGQGAFRLAKPDHYVLRADETTITPFGERTSDKGEVLPLCVGQDPDPPRDCGDITILRASASPVTVHIAARARVRGEGATALDGVILTTACQGESWTSCLVIPLKEPATVVPSPLLDQWIAYPLRALVATGQPRRAATAGAETAKTRPTPANVPLAPPPHEELKAAAPPGPGTQTTQTQTTQAPARVVFLSLSGEGDLPVSFRNYRKPLEVPAENDFEIRNFGTIDVLVEIRIPTNMVASDRRRDEGRASVGPCESGDAPAQCVRAGVLRDSTVRIPRSALRVNGDTEARLTIRALIGMSVTSDGYLLLRAGEGLMPPVPPPPPPQPQGAGQAQQQAQTPPKEETDACGKPLKKGEKPPNRKPPTSSLDLFGNFFFNKLADFDRNNDGDDAISASEPYDGGYFRQLKGKATLQFRRTNAPLEGNVKMVFQDSVFGGIDSRLQKNTLQSTLTKIPVIKIDDPVSVEEWFFKVTPTPYAFLQVGKMLLATSETMAGREAAEGLQVTFMPQCSGVITLTPAYGVIREGINSVKLKNPDDTSEGVVLDGLMGVSDERERDSDLAGFDFVFDATLMTTRPPIAPTLKFAFRHVWDRGPDQAAFAENFNSFYGTQKRYTIGFDFIQRITMGSDRTMGGERTLTARGALYHSRLRGDDVAATRERQEGRGTVVRLDLVTPIWDGFGQLAGTFARGSNDRADTGTLNEGFLGNDQKSFSEATFDDKNPEADSIYFKRIVSALQVRPIVTDTGATTFASAFGLSNKVYAGVAWNSPYKYKDSANPLRNVVVRLKYRAIWHRDLGDISGFGGHEVAMRITGLGTWTPYAGITYFQPGDRLRKYIDRPSVVQVLLGASVNITLFKTEDK